MLRLLLVLCGVALYAPVEQKPILVAAAISLSDALREVAAAYKAAGGGAVEFNFAGSNVLARQIANGAPVDMFISADEAQMDYAQQRDGIDARSRIALLSNRLAVVTPSGEHTFPTEPRSLLGTFIRRIAIGDPAAVPAGVYTRQYLERVELWQPLQRKLLPLVNVRAALAAVQSGSVDAAIVYESDTVAASGIRLVCVINDDHAPRIIYPAAITKVSKRADAARQFLAFLQGPEATRIFERFKFSRPTAR